MLNYLNHFFRTFNLGSSSESLSSLLVVSESVDEFVLTKLTTLNKLDEIELIRLI